MPTVRVRCQDLKFDVYCGRGSKWGNPYTHIKDRETLADFVVENRTVAIEKFKEYVLNREDLLLSLQELKGKRLGCWCGLDEKCHVDVLIQLVNEIDSQNDYF